MPNIKSAKKRVKVNTVKAANNKAAKSNLKTVLKKVDAAISNNAADKNEVVKLAIKKIDQAAAQGLIHKNNAARKVSRVSKAVNSIA